MIRTESAIKRKQQECILELLGMWEHKFPIVWKMSLVGQRYSMLLYRRRAMVHALVDLGSKVFLVRLAGRANGCKHWDGCDWCRHWEDGCSGEEEMIAALIQSIRPPKGFPKVRYVRLQSIATGERAVTRRRIEDDIRLDNMSGGQFDRRFPRRIVAGLSS